MTETGHRGRWNMSSIFQTSHPNPKSMLFKALILWRKNSICQIEEMADVFLNSANFAPHTILTLAPPSRYALNLKPLIKVSTVCWTSQLLYKLLRSSFERKFDKTNFVSPKKTPPKSPQFLGLIEGYYSIFWGVLLTETCANKNSLWKFKFLYIVRLCPWMRKSEKSLGK